MVIVNFQIAFTDDFKIEQAMPREKLEHVIEKRQARIDAPAAAAVQIQLDSDVGFFGAPIDRNRPCCGLLRCRHTLVYSCLKMSRRAAINLPFSSGDPTLTRK